VAGHLGRELTVRRGRRHVEVGPRDGHNGILGAAAIARAEERRVERLKQAGLNAIRSSHNPISRTMLDACDESGMLVMEELFDMWTEGKTVSPLMRRPCLGSSWSVRMPKRVCCLSSTRVGVRTTVSAV
jgi:beta-galactosidase/beta-glucuronidase